MRSTQQRSRKGRNQTALDDAVRAMRRAFVVIALFSAAINILMLASPIYMLQVYDRVLTTGRHETLIALTVLAAGALLILALLDWLRGSINIRIGQWLSEMLGPTLIRTSVRAQLKGQPVGAQPLRDLSQLQTFLSSQGLAFAFDFPWVPFFILLIWLLHPILGVTALIAAVLLMVLSALNEVVTLEPNKRTTAAQIEATSHADAAIRNAEAVWAMGMLPQLIDRWRSTHGGAMRASLSSSEWSGFITSIIKFIRFFVQIAILGLGAILVLKGELSAGSMIAASILLGRALAPVEMAVAAWKSFTSARLAYGRLQTLLGALPPEAERMLLPEPTGRVVVDRLTYVSPDTGVPVLRGVSFEVEPGEIIAVIGPSGAGKSTLCRFLVGIAQPSGGAVKLDGSELGHWDPEQLGRSIGYLPQDVELFAGTVRENIARMSDGPDDEVTETAILAHAHEIIQRLPRGYETEIGDRGGKLSGGQRQRIGLARAIYGRPALLVLDEPNANLDQAGESALAAALGELKSRGTAIIVVGHRPSTIAQADKVLLLREGQVEIFGPRDDVMRRLKEASAQKSTLAPSERQAPSGGTPREADAVAGPYSEVKTSQAASRTGAP